MSGNNCPHCGSSHTARCSLVYQQGTSSGSVSLAGISTDGTLSSAGGLVSNSTMLSRSCAPPGHRVSSAEELWIGVGVTAAILLTVNIVIAIFNDSRFTREDARSCLILTLPILGGLAVRGFVGIHRITSNRRYLQHQYPSVKARYDRTWICLQCGFKFERISPTAGAPAKAGASGVDYVIDARRRESTRSLRWRVDGVDQESHLETTIYVTASNEKAARVKAELQGVIITEIGEDDGALA